MVTPAVLAGLSIPPLFTLWLVSFFVARKKYERVRKGVVWLKLALPAWIL